MPSGVYVYRVTTFVSSDGGHPPLDELELLEEDELLVAR